MEYKLLYPEMKVPYHAFKLPPILCSSQGCYGNDREPTETDDLSS